MMVGLSRDELCALRPYGPAGECVPNYVFQRLVARGLGRWVADEEGAYFCATPMGELIARVCEAAP